MAPQSSVPGEDRYQGFPDGFFTRSDEDDDRGFYGQPRLVQHIDDGAIAAVRDLYDGLGLYGEVLDLCSSWVSHLARTPQRLVVLGMNAFELERNPQAHERVVKDLNREPVVMTNEIIALVTKPRIFGKIGTQSLGTPVFNQDGKFLGIGINRFGPKGDSEGQGPAPSNVILPAADLLESASQAK